MLFVSVPVLAVALLWIVLREPVEPVYQGKKLSEWVAQYAFHRSVDQESERAIRAIGTNGLPCMVRWLPRTRDKVAEQKYKWFTRISRSPRPLAMMLFRVPGIRNWSWQGQSTMPSVRALTCFQILKKDGAPALPKLVHFATENEELEIRVTAIMAMSFIGRDAVPALYKMVTNREYANRPSVAAALGEIREAGERHEVVIALLDCYREQDIALARCAGDALGKLAVEPELIVPPLIEGLKNQNLTFTCARSLGRYGAAAREAVTPLLQALNEPNQAFRREILETLRDLAPGLVPAEQRSEKGE
jgi:hypothetical protein